MLGSAICGWLQSPYLALQMSIRDTSAVIAPHLRPVPIAGIGQLGISDQMRVGYRTGDMWAPRLDTTEALSVEGEHFIDCIEHGKVPQTDGHLGLRVVELIEAATSSMRGKGETVYIQRRGKI